MNRNPHLMVAAIPPAWNSSSSLRNKMLSPIKNPSPLTATYRFAALTGKYSMLLIAVSRISINASGPLMFRSHI